MTYKNHCFNFRPLPAWWLCKAIRPDPIPNSAVKRLSANGTLSQDTESRSPPGLQRRKAFL